MNDLIGLLQRFSRFLWDIDPGYFKLKHGVKTIAGILFALFLTQHEHTVSKLIAGIACGVSMQGVVARPFSSRVLQVLMFNAFYFTTFLVGLAVRDDPSQTAVVLVFMAFSVNYLRRYGLQASLAPMMAWLLCFMATFLPFPNTDIAYDNIHGLVVGLSVSAMMTLIIFPDNYPKLFVSNSNLIFSTVVQSLNEIRAHVLGAKRRRYFDNNFFKACQSRLTRLIDSNQAIEQAKVFGINQKKVTDVLIHEYGLVNAFLMMQDAYHTLSVDKDSLPAKTRMALSRVTKQFADLFVKVKMNKQYQIDAKKYGKGPSTLDVPRLVRGIQWNTEDNRPRGQAVGRRCGVSLIKFTEILSRSSVTDPALVISLMNLKLSFILFNQHIEKLIEASHENE